MDSSATDRPESVVIQESAHVETGTSLIPFLPRPIAHSPGLPANAILVRDVLGRGENQRPVGDTRPPQPVNAEPRTAQEVQELAEFEEATLALEEQCFRAVRRICIASPVLIVFCVGIASAIMNWNRYESLKAEAGWTRESAILVSNRTVADPTGDGITFPASKVWRAEAVVRDYGLEDRNETVVALFRNEADAWKYRETQEEAQKRIDKLHLYSIAGKQ